MSILFEPITLRGLEIPNRIWLPPMCQYQAADGVLTDHHFVHYGARAQGGYGLMIVEATGVVPEGRISTACPGLWNDEQQAAWARVVDFAHAQGRKIAIQLSHAGRKGSTYPALPGFPHATVPAAEGGWQTVAPSAIASAGLETPRELSAEEIQALPQAFADAAKRAIAAGFDALEIHGAHGYLLHQFLSPLSNQRTDEWGGDFAGRTRLLIEVCRAIRQVMPEQMPLIVRLSATDWTEGGWDVAQTTSLAEILAQEGVDFIDVSSGGNVLADIPIGPGYQVDLAAAVRSAGLPVSAVGLITEAEQAEEIIASGQADAVEIGRLALRDPYWPRNVAAQLGHAMEPVPSYARAY